MPSLSIVMIVKDESACLADCLRSVQAIADEMVIGDTGSTDDTPAIARSFGAKVIDVPWRNDFAAARNAVLAEARGDWLLHLDADEMLDEEGAAAIRALVDADGAGADAIELTLANYCDDPRAWRWVPSRPDDPMARGKTGYIAVQLLRLFRNHRGYAYREAVHENITESVVEAGGRTGRADIIVHHYGYTRAQEQSEAKAKMYLAIAREKTRQHAGSTKAWHDYAEQALACGDAKTAEEACRTALGIDPSDIDSVTTLANILLNRGELDNARSLLDDLDTQRGLPPHLLVARAAIACRQGKVEEAQANAQAALDAAPHNVMARLELARALDRLKAQPSARVELETAHRLAPALRECADRLEAHRLREDGEALYLRGEAESALATLVQALKRDPEDPLLLNDIGVVLAALERKNEARASLERALKLAPDLEDARANLDAL